MPNNAKVTESFVAQTVVGGRYDGKDLDGEITVNSVNEKTTEISTNLLDTKAKVLYSNDVESNVTLYRTTGEIKDVQD